MSRIGIWIAVFVVGTGLACSDEEFVIEPNPCESGVGQTISVVEQDGTITVEVCDGGVSRVEFWLADSLACPIENPDTIVVATAEGVVFEPNLYRYSAELPPAKHVTAKYFLPSGEQWGRECIR